MKRIGLIGLMVMMAAVLALCLVPTVQAQLPAIPRVGTLMSATNIAGNTLVTLNTNAFTVYPGRGLSLFASAAATNTSISNVTVVCEVSPDNTNWSTTSLLTWTFGLNSTTGVIPWTNWAPSVVDNVYKVRLRSITNGHSSTLFLTNIIWSQTPP